MFEIVHTASFLWWSFESLTLAQVAAKGQGRPNLRQGEKDSPVGALGKTTANAAHLAVPLGDQRGPRNGAKMPKVITVLFAIANAHGPWGQGYMMIPQYGPIWC